jgi:hypothetical protein
MKDLWLKIGCFITGHNYQIVKNSTEISAKSVKKYLSAILIISILWGFIGYTFSKNYLQTDAMISGIVALVMVIIVVQIERQIILTVGRTGLAFGFRALIGIVMAVLGSVIIDQIMFKDDIEKKQISNIQEEVNNILPGKTLQLDFQIHSLDSSIFAKEAERASLIAELDKKPFTRSRVSETTGIVLQKRRPDGTLGDTLIRNTDYTFTDIRNPKEKLLPMIDSQLEALRTQKAEKEDAKINIRQSLESELKEITGFLDELLVLKSILSSTWVAMVVWSLFFVFFLSLELFVLFNKIGDKGNDYDMTIMHQMDQKKALLKSLARNQSERDTI